MNRPITCSWPCLPYRLRPRRTGRRSPSWARLTAQRCDSLWQFDDQRNDAVRDDRLWRGQRRWQRIQHQHRRHRFPKHALVQRHRRRIPGDYPIGSLTLCGSSLFGTTNTGGTSGDGTIFRVKTDGSGFQSLLSFSGTNGGQPPGPL